MFHKFGEIFAKYPWYIAGGVIGVVIVIWLLSRGSGSTVQPGGIVAYGPSDTQIAAGAAVEAARIEANAATAQAQFNGDLQLKLAPILAGVNADNNKTAVDLTTITTGSSLAITNSNNAAAVTMNGKTMDSNVQIAKYGYDASQSAAQAQSAAQLELARIAASVTAAQIGSNDINLAAERAYAANQHSQDINADLYKTTGLVPPGDASDTVRHPPVFVSADQGNGGTAASVAAARAARG